MTDLEVREPGTRRRSRRSGVYLRLASGVAIVATLVFAVALANRFGTDPTLVASPLIGEPAPEVIVPRLDGEGELDLAELRGKVVVVNFWASWCVACRAEHDDLVATASAFQERGVTFVGVVYQDDLDSAAGFLDELGRGANYEYVLDPGSRTAISFGCSAFPRPSSSTEQASWSARSPENPTLSS